jgi:hypothetical protein
MTDEGRKYYVCYNTRNHKCKNIGVNFLYDCVMQPLQPDALVRKKFGPLVTVFYTYSASQMLNLFAVPVSSQLKE